jgi:hypothetical protein
VEQSFGVAVVRIQFGPLSPSPSAPIPPAPGVPPPTVIPPVVLGAPPVLAPNVAPSIPTVSVQALGAGFLGAGFTRVAQKNRPVAVGQANLNPKKGGPRRPRLPPRPVGRFV